MSYEILFFYDINIVIIGRFWILNKIDLNIFMFYYILKV